MPVSTPVICGSLAASSGKLGPILHNAGYRELGLNYTYVSFGIDDLRGAIHSMRALGIRGLAVSMPYKIEAIQYLDSLDPTAKEIGAINTIVNTQGKLGGYNTDWVGATSAINEVKLVENEKVALFGAGGAARAIAYALKKKNCSVTIFNRSAPKGEALAKSLGLTFGGTFDALPRNAQFDILVNATPVGSASSNLPEVIPDGWMKPGMVAFDAVFNPLRTSFLFKAEEVGCLIVPGFKMLLHQAYAQFELYTGETPPVKVMEQALVDALSTK